MRGIAAEEDLLNLINDYFMSETDDGDESELFTEEEEEDSHLPKPSPRAPPTDPSHYVPQVQSTGNS